MKIARDGDVYKLSDGEQEYTLCVNKQALAVLYATQVLKSAKEGRDAFRLVDNNGDGIISKSEFQTASPGAQHTLSLLAAAAIKESIENINWFAEKIPQVEALGFWKDLELRMFSLLGGKAKRIRYLKNQIQGIKDSVRNSFPDIVVE